MSGAWTMTDDGEFLLDPAYKEKLDEIKRTIRMAWLDSICGELAKSTSYTQEELLDAFLTRMENDRTEVAVEVVDSFIIEALEGSI